MNLILKYKLLKKDYSYINTIILFKPEEILKLNSSEQLVIIKDLVANSDLESLKRLFCLTSNYAFRKMIIDQVKNSINHRFLDELIKECLYAFIEYATLSDDLKFIEYLANFIEDSNIVNLEYIDLLKKHLLIHSISDYTIRIACLPKFRDSKFEEKIAKSRNYSYILYYILNTNKNSKFLKKVLLTELNCDDFKRLCIELSSKKPTAFQNLKRITNILVKEKKLCAKYLIILIELYPNNENRKKYIDTIISLNNFNSIKSLMAILNPEEQEIYASEALRKNDIQTILNLACTTNCSKTQKLISYSITWGTFSNRIFLITNLKGEYLNFALEKLLIEQGYRKFMNIYLYLHDNNDVAYITMLNYIFDNHLESSFSSYYIILKTHKELLDIEQNLERVLHNN